MKSKIYVKTAEARKESSVSRKQRTDFSQSTSSPIDQILSLQRTIGNQAVQRLFKSGVIQAKLKIVQPNDIYEQEADRVADAVMRMQREVDQAKPIAEEITPLSKNSSVFHRFTRHVRTRAHHHKIRVFSLEFSIVSFISNPLHPMQWHRWIACHRRFSTTSPPAGS